MRKKFFFTLVLIILIISEITIVYADLIIPGRHFNEYKGVEKFEDFIKSVKSPLKEIVVLLLILFVTIGLVLITFKKIENKENKSSKTILGLRKAFFGISVILDLLSIYILKIALLFSSSFSVGTMVDKEMRASVINGFISIIYGICVALIIISFIASAKKNNKKILYIITTGTIIVLFIIIVLIILNTDAGYYTYDKSYYDFFNFK